MRRNCTKLSIAPMLDYTDSYFRRIFRVINREILVYTEMTHAKTIIHGNADSLLNIYEIEHPVALQLAGSDPEELHEATKIAKAFGYDEFNLNMGCPKLQSSFGAIMMKNPELAAECFKAIAEASEVPVTVKSRIGIDDLDSYEFLRNFIEKLSRAGCQEFIIHARKAILKGLSPKANRSIPPLDYQKVWNLKSEFPDLRITINGGIRTIYQIQKQLNHVDAVMIGRHAYSNPTFFYGIGGKDSLKGTQKINLSDILNDLKDTIESDLILGGKIKNWSRHLISLAHGHPKARILRRILSDHSILNDNRLDPLIDRINDQINHPR